MCWIFWYLWESKNASKVLLHWLERLEYRWYDSAWIAVGNQDWKINLVKSVWKVSFLSEKTDEILEENTKYSYWIAHTRWATHGWVTESNCHPHHDSENKIYLVHNWIIENYKQLKDQLIAKWYAFYWDTDSEVVAKLAQDNWQWSLLKTVEFILPMLEWAYALLFISKDDPKEMIWVKYWSPLVFAFDRENQEAFFSSDTQALAWYAEKIIFLDDGELVHVKNWDYKIKSEWRLIEKKAEKMDISSLASEKWDYEHFMLKEIYEQPRVLEDVFRWRVNFEDNTLNSAAFHELSRSDFKRVVFIACGTSYHAWWLGCYWFEDIAWMDAKVEVASEFEYKTTTIKEDTLYIFVSQSWETADAIEPLKYIKSKWWKTFWIVNVVGSTISRLTDYWLFTRAWTEVWVASTKAFVAQIATILILALYFWEKNNFPRIRYKEIIESLKHLPEAVSLILKDTQRIKEISWIFSDYKQFFFLWRHFELPIAYEASLKFKEISYLNSQALPTWELKHWSLALIDENFPSVIFAPKNFLFEKNLSSIQEIKARKWKVLTISENNISTSDWNILVPEVNEFLTPFTMIVAWQLLSYYTSLKLWREIDKPRNLAKSVTVK